MKARKFSNKSESKRGLLVLQNMPDFALLQYDSYNLYIVDLDATLKLTS